jgi:hypothetical protein
MRSFEAEMRAVLITGRARFLLEEFFMLETLAREID